MIVVAIDGPAGSGKSTVAQRLAVVLDVPHVDTGAYFRAATLAVLRADVDPADSEQVPAVIADADIRRVGGRTLLDGHDVEEEIRAADVTAHVSAVAAQPRVREVLLAVQRAGLSGRGGVVEGRDAATRVVPDATLKVWLDADVNERGRRRAEQAGQPDRVDDHVRDLIRRDTADSRQMDRDPAAVAVDTTGMTIQEVVDHLAAMARAAAHRLESS